MQVSLLGITSRQNNEDVHLPYKPQERGHCRKSEKSTLMEMDGRDDAVKRRPFLLHGHEKEDLLERPNPRPLSSQSSASSASFVGREAINSEGGHSKSYPGRIISNREHRDLPRRSRFS